MTAPTQITTHVPDALARLVQYYQSSPLLQGQLSAYVTQVQDLEDAIFGMLSGRGLADAAGTQLDNLGQVVGLTRQPSWSDATYRTFIRAQIGVNVSQGDAERLMAIFQLVTAASHVALQEPFPASIGMMCDGTLDPSLTTLLKTFLASIAAAGVNVDFIGSYDPLNPFCMAGGTGFGSGFGDATDATVGGKLASLF